MDAGSRPVAGIKPTHLMGSLMHFLVCVLGFAPVKGIDELRETKRKDHSKNKLSLIFLKIIKVLILDWSNLKGTSS